MARLFLILVAVFLLLASSQVLADQLKPEEFPVSDERMADLVELAASGKLTIPGVLAPEEETAQRQVGFLRHIITARDSASLGASPSANPVVATRVGDDYAAQTCYRAVMAARAGDHYAAQVFLEESFRTNRDEHHGYYLVLYRRWTAETLSYRLLCWWAEHVSGPHPLTGVLALMAAAQFLALPLLIKLRHAIKSGRRGRALIGPALGAAFAELVPLCWAVASGPAWAFAYEMSAIDSVFGFAFFSHLAAFTVFMICSRDVMSRLARMLIGIAILFFGWVPIVGPSLTLLDRDLVSRVGICIGAIFWSGTFAVLIYFLLLHRRERLTRQPV